MTKHLLLSLGACVALTWTATSAFGQDCSSFLLLQKDKTVEVTSYDKKGEPTGRQVYQVKDVTTAAGVTTGTINSELFDKNGNSKAKANTTIQCKDGEIRFDMKMLLSPQQSQQFNVNAQANGQNNYLTYPGNMKVGDQLPDGNLTIDMSHNGAPAPGGNPPPGGPPAPGNGPPPPPGFAKSMTMVINNRKVEGQESVTTTAGTWNCFRISYKSRVVVKTGPFGIPVNVEGIEWYAPGFGIIKSQSKSGGTAITSIK